MPRARPKAQLQPRTSGPTSEVRTRRVKPGHDRPWTFADLALALQRDAKARTRGDLERVKILGPGVYELEL